MVRKWRASKRMEKDRKEMSYFRWRKKGRARKRMETQTENELLQMEREWRRYIEREWRETEGK